MIKISIIIPVYNAENYLSSCINSILKQTYYNWEIIIVDDGSTDNSKSIYTKFAEEDKRIKFFYQKNKGVSAARNLGIEMAKGDYIVFVDADDWIEATFLEKMLKVLEKEHADIVQCNFYYTQDNENVMRKHIKPSYSVRENTEELQLDILYREYEEKKYCRSVGAIRGVWGKIFKTSIINNIKFNEEIDIFEDGIFILNVLQNVHKVVLIDEYLYYYRITENSSNIKYKPDFNQKALIIFENIKRFIIENNKDKDFESCFHLMVFEMISSTLDKDIFNIQNKCKRKEKVNVLKNWIKNTYCQDALEQVQKENLGKNQRLLYYLLKRKMYTIIYYLYIIKQKIKKRKIIR